MLVTTNYPQVPIATTNVATDSVRADNQQRPIIQPTTKTEKSHGEREVNKYEHQALPSKRLSGAYHGQPPPNTELTLPSYKQTNSQVIPNLANYVKPKITQQQKANQNISHQSPYKGIIVQQVLMPIDTLAIKSNTQQHTSQYFREVGRNIANYYQKSHLLKQQSDFDVFL